REVAHREPTAPGATPVAPDTFAAPPAHPQPIAEEWLYAVRHELRDARAPRPGAGSVSARVALARVQEDPGALYLLVSIDDDRWVAPGAGAEPGDAVIVEAGDTEGTLQPLPAGAVPNLPPSADGTRRIVLRLAPEPRLLRVRVVDVDDAVRRRIDAEADSGPIAPLRLRPPPTDAEREAALAALRSALGVADGRITLYNDGGMIIARHGELDAERAPPRRWDQRLARTLLQLAARLGPEPGAGLDTDEARQQVAWQAVTVALTGRPATSSARLAGDDGLASWMLASAAPVRSDGRVIGAVVVQDSTAGRLRPGEQALERMALTTAAAFAATVVAVLLLASITVARILRLRRLAERAIDEHGRVVAAPRGSLVPDEIGDLANSYASVLQRLREHQDYVARLRSRLVHELRTPIMVVRSSLENLAAESAPERQALYARRAQQGAARLERIVSSMGEAGRLETMLADAEREPVNLSRLLSACVDGYRSAFSPRRLELAIAAGGAAAPIVDAVPEALAQALDKLVANAVDFAAAGTPITVRLDPLEPPPRAPAAGWAISVHNVGAPLPEGSRERLFESMVSLRDAAGGDAAHLGLGLHIVRLIAEFHGGRCFARNVAGGVQVGFTVAATAVR
ncbi:MAG TPA: ATP-binding protein, partial [Burkholderiaceae bacterium]|nr:ATP-binding protein [Burkholderiaceae bacterium]